MGMEEEQCALGFEEGTSELQSVTSGRKGCCEIINRSRAEREKIGVCV
jgi:hypothetical protein